MEEHNIQSYSVDRVRFLLPVRTSTLHNVVASILGDVGFKSILSRERKLIINRGVFTFVFVKGSDIPSLVEDGYADLGICGYDYVVERKSNIWVASKLGHLISEIVLVVRGHDDTDEPDDIREGSIIATPYVSITSAYFQSLGKRIKILPVKGSTEAILFLDKVNAIVDITTSGTTIKKNNLKIISKILKTEPCLVINESFKKAYNNHKLSNETINIIDRIRSIGDSWHKNFVVQ